MKIIHKTKISFLALTTILCCCKGDIGDIGINGLNNLTSITQVMPGQVCKAGGLKIEIGLDANSNGTLELEEINDTKYVCNGINGEMTLSSFHIEASGTNCDNGGLKIYFGIDTNKNNILDKEEIINYIYLCNGIDGNSTLTRITRETSGDNCEKGGVKIDSGVDINNNGLLDQNEILNTTYICDGAVGTISIINIEDIPISEEYLSGGIQIESGIDVNGNGKLEDFEIKCIKSIYYGINGQSIEEIRLVLISVGTGALSFSNGISAEAINFDKRNWSNASAVFYTAKISTSDTLIKAFVELYDRYEREIITNSTLSTKNTEYVNLSSENILHELPEKEVLLSLKLRSDNNEAIVKITGRSELIIYQEKE